MFEVTHRFTIQPFFLVSLLTACGAGDPSSSEVESSTTNQAGTAPPPEAARPDSPAPILPPAERRLRAIAGRVLREGPALQLLDALPCGDGEGALVVWQAGPAAEFVEYARLSADGTWSEVSTTETHSSRGARRTVHLRPDGGPAILSAARVLTPGTEPAETSPPFDIGASVGLPSGGLWALRQAQPKNPFAGFLDFATGEWETFENPLDEELDFSLALPRGEDGFQLLRYRRGAGKNTLFAQVHDQDGQLVGSEDLGAVGVTSHHVTPDAGVLLVVNEQTPGGLQLSAWDYRPERGWTGPEALGSLGASALAPLASCSFHDGAGRAIVPLKARDANDSSVFWKAGEGEAWSRQSAERIVQPLASSADASGAMVLAGLGVGNSLQLLVRPGGRDASWSSHAGRSVEGLKSFTPCSYHVRLVPLEPGRFLLVATASDAVRTAFLSFE